MNWLNLEIRMLRTPAYIGSDPIERATWLNVLAHCCEQENGGRMEGAANWKDRQWQQLCGVTAREVYRARRLLTVDGSDVVVFGYPSEKAAEVKAKREAGKRTAERRWGQKQSPEAISSAISEAITSPDAEGERKEKGKEIEENPPGARVFVILPTLDQAKAYAPTAGVSPDAAESWWLSCDSRGISPDGRFIDRDGREIRNWQSSLTKFGRSWQSNEQRKLTPRQQQVKTEPAPKLPIAPDAHKTVQDMFAEGRAKREREEAIAAGEEVA